MAVGCREDSAIIMTLLERTQALAAQAGAFPFGAMRFTIKAPALFFA
jgi:hypothetical protein